MLNIDAELLMRDPPNATQLLIFPYPLVLHYKFGYLRSLLETETEDLLLLENTGNKRGS